MFRFNQLPQCSPTTSSKYLIFTSTRVLSPCIVLSKKYIYSDSISTDQVFKDVNSFDKSLAEKLAFIEQLDKKDKIAFYAVLDAFIGKKKLKDVLSDVK